MINSKKISLLLSGLAANGNFRRTKVWQKEIWKTKLSFGVVTVPFSMSLFSFSTFLTGCSDLAGGTQKNNIATDTSTEVSANKTDDSTSSNSTDSADNTDKVYEALGNSYARRAAKDTSLCPKLLQRDIDNPVITRRHEYMRGQYCDYYLYPRKGQSLAINAYGANVKVFLEMPESYDFENGPYLVKENRRHIIRVKYNGIQHKPPKFEYNIDFNLE